MHIELSEILTCPDCRSPQGLIVMVEELDDEGRVREGDLGCSRCERRYPVRGGAVDLSGPAAGDAAEGTAATDSGSGPAAPDDLPEPEELTAELGALLDLREGRGPVVLGHGLLPAAGGVAGISGDLRVLALVASGGEPPAGAFTLARVSPGRLPLLPGKARGVGLWRPTPAAAERARRALAPGGRLALLRPSREVRRELESSDLEVIASEERAAAARRAG